MANHVADSQIWEFVMAAYVAVFMSAITLIISVAAYWKASQLVRYIQQIAEKISSLRGLDSRTKLLETLHEERLLRMKMQLELQAINSQTSYVFRFGSESVKKQLEKHQSFFEQLEQLEKMSSECEVNSEKLYCEVETWLGEMDPKVYNHLWSKANLFRNQAQQQLEIAKFVRSKLQLNKFG